MQTRSYRFGDVIESIQHGASLFVSKFTSKTAHGIRKENLPAEVATELYNAAEALRRSGFPQVADRVLRGVMDGGGVKMFLDNLQRELLALPDEDSVRAMESINEHLDPIDKILQKLNGNIDNRMGNEIMLEIKDLIPGE